MSFKEPSNVDGVEVNACPLAPLKSASSIISLPTIIGKSLRLVFPIASFEDRDLDTILIISIFKLYLSTCTNR